MALVSGAAAHAAGNPTIEVMSDIGNVTSYTSVPQGANETLADAIWYANAHPNTTITFASQLSGSTGNTIDLAAGDPQPEDLQALTQSTTIDGPGITINAANSAYNVFSNPDAGSGQTLSINGLHIEGLAWNNQPGDVYAAVYSQVPLTLTDVTITGTQATSGGSDDIAVKVSNTSATLSSDTIAHNASNCAPVVATDFNSPSATMSINDTTISGNTDSGDCAGGIAAYDADTTISNSTVSGNQSVSSGGGIWVSGGSLILSGSTVADDSSEADAGGIGLTDGASGEIYASTVSGNTASGGAGGGIFADAGTLAITNSTVYDNRADTDGGAISLANGSTGLTAVGDTVDHNTARDAVGGIDAMLTTAATVNLDDTVVAGNVATTGIPDVGSSSSVTTKASFSLIGIGDPADTNGPIVFDSTDQVGTGSTPLAPDLGPLTDNGGVTTTPTGPVQTQLPTATSPLINAGDAADFNSPPTQFTTDELGNPRPVDFYGVPVSHSGDGTDIGAVELSSPTAPTPNPTPPVPSPSPSAPGPSAGAPSTTTQTSAITTAAPAVTTTPAVTPIHVGVSIRTTVARLDDQAISVSRMSGSFARSVSIDFKTSRIAGSKKTKLTFASAAFTWRGDKRPAKTIRRDSQKVELSLSGLKQGAHTLEISVSYRERVSSNQTRTVTARLSVRIEVR